MSRFDKNEELFELLGMLASGVISSAQHARLEQLLAGDDEACQIYLDYLDVDLALQQRQVSHDEVESVLDFGRFIEQLPELTQPPAAEPTHPLVRYGLVAVATLCVSLLVQYVFHLDEENPAANVEPVLLTTAVAAAPQEPEYLATLRRTADCEWDDGQILRAGWRLMPGELRLKQGVAEIRFDSGTELVVEGPSTLRLDSADSAMLLRGKVVVHSDAISNGFQLCTPSSNLVDWGGEYGVSVDPSGDSEVHVFEGEVHRWRSDSASGAGTEVLTAGMAKRFSPSEETSEKLTTLAKDRFVRRVPKSGEVPFVPELNVLAYEGFDYAAYELAQGDGGIGWASPWYEGYPTTFPQLRPYEGLTRTGAAVLPLGGRLEHTGLAAARRKLSVPLRLDTDGVYYMSFLLQRDGGDNPRYLGIQFRGNNDDDWRERLSFGLGASNEVFIRCHDVCRRAAFSVRSGSVYLLVAKIVTGKKCPDQVMLRIYRPRQHVHEEEPAHWTCAIPPVHKDFVYDSLLVRFDADGPQGLDEIRIGTTWASVTAAWTE